MEPLSKTMETTGKTMEKSSEMEKSNEMEKPSETMESRDKTWKNQVKP